MPDPDSKTPAAGVTKPVAPAPPTARTGPGAPINPVAPLAPVGPDAPEGPDPFLLAEYENLNRIEISRNDRLDRFITLFLTIAGAPFAVYSLTIGKDVRADLLSMPNLISCIFLLASVLGFLVVMIIVQIRLNILLYMRAANAIRGYLSRGSGIKDALLLPRSYDVPHYYEKWKHTHQTIIAMALVNSLYAGLAIYNLAAGLSLSILRVCVSGLIALICFYLHWWYYERAAANRESQDKGPGKLHFAKPQDSGANP
jgi:hypothetical protein